MSLPTPELRWIRLAAGAAGAKILLVTIAFLIAVGGGTIAEAVYWVNLAIVVTYGGVGGALLLGGRFDLRARELGAFLILVATAFASGGLGRLGHPLGGVTSAFVSLPIEAFIPAALWLFVRDFPSRAPLGWPFLFPSRALRVSLIIGAVLFAANAVADITTAAGVPDVGRWLAFVSRQSSGTVFWPLVFLLTLPAAPVLVARSRRLGPGDGRRVRLFIGMVVAGLLPLSVDVLLRATVPAWNRLLEQQPVANQIVLAVGFVAFLSVPFTTAYSVVVSRVVDWRLVVRRALQYAMAQYSLLALASLPFVGIGWLLYSNSALTIRQLLFSGLGALLLAIALAAIILLWLRRRALLSLDRRFFREQYDAREVLVGLVSASSSADSTLRLADLLANEIDRALHLDRLAVLVRTDDGGRFESHDGRTRPLAGDAVLPRLLAASPEPLDVEPDNPRSVLRRLEPAEQAWLADGGFQLLVPLRGSDGSLAGVMALGEKRSELPFSADDRRLLAAVGASGGLYLESRRLGRTPHAVEARRTAAPVLAGAARAARECPKCGRVFDASATACVCDGVLIEAPVPKVLADKFQIERRIGAGGMGVVYFATDLALGRAVAIKTLPTAGADHTWRLRREARAMARVSHENLALIYGAESWNGVPLLVQEYLAGGTLADRLRGGPMALDAALQMCATLSTALEVLHGAGLVHRDVKPSNIGYNSAGVIKLLDFGLAQIFGTDAETATTSTGDSTTRPLATLPNPTHHALGTPAYMSPEALRNEVPSAAFDVWSLTVVLLEAVSGKNPYRGDTLLDTLSRIAAPLDVLAVWPAARADMQAFFLEALAHETRRRPASATVFRQQILGLMRPD